MAVAVDKFLESLAYAIMALSDYFVLKKRVTLSETGMALASILWFIFFWVTPDAADHSSILTPGTWMALFGVSFCIHVIAFAFQEILVRAYVAGMAASVWLSLTILSLYTGSHAPAWPTLAVFVFFSLWIAVRLFRERQQQ